MKRNLILLCTALIISTTFLSGQDGRPQYKIRNERAGVFIGDIVVELFPYIAPLHVANFDSLVSISFYDSLAWHRVVPNFVIQGGDPNSKNGPRSTWGEGDSTQATVPAEFSKVTHARGIIGAARDTDINSATSQFYINTINNSGLDGRYTAYGIVVEGMDVVDDIEASPRDANDNPIEKIEMFITKLGINENVPGTPELVEPADDYQGFTTATNIVWTPDSTSVLSFLEIAEDSNFSNIVFSDNFAVTGENSSVRFSDAQIGLNTYYWRVKENNGAKFSEYSETRSFTTSIVPPELTSPENSSKGVVRNPLLVWQPVDGADSYRLQVSNTFPSFTAPRLIIDETGIEATQKQLEGLEANTRYYWRVLCETETYESPYSNFWLFTTEDVTGVKEVGIPTEFSLDQNYPNPFNPSTIIKFGLPEQSFVDLRVYNVLGQEVARLLNEKLQPGNHEVNFNASSLSSGMYFYRLEIGNEYKSIKKMLLLK